MFLQQTAIYGQYTQQQQQQQQGVHRLVTLATQHCGVSI
jgi:hypothetical protein